LYFRNLVSDCVDFPLLARRVNQDLCMRPVEQAGDFCRRQFLVQRNHDTDAVDGRQICDIPLVARFSQDRHPGRFQRQALEVRAQRVDILSELPVGNRQIGLILVRRHAGQGHIALLHIGVLDQKDRLVSVMLDTLPEHIAQIPNRSDIVQGCVFHRSLPRPLPFRFFLFSRHHPDRHHPDNQVI